MKKKNSNAVSCGSKQQIGERPVVESRLLEAAFRRAWRHPRTITRSEALDGDG